MSGARRTSIGAASKQRTGGQQAASSGSTSSRGGGGGGTCGSVGSAECVVYKSTAHCSSSTTQGRGSGGGGGDESYSSTPPITPSSCGPLKTGWEGAVTMSPAQSSTYSPRGGDGGGGYDGGQSYRSSVASTAAVSSCEGGGNTSRGPQPLDIPHTQLKQLLAQKQQHHLLQLPEQEQEQEQEQPQQEQASHMRGQIGHTSPVPSAATATVSAAAATASVVVAVKGNGGHHSGLLSPSLDDLGVTAGAVASSPTVMSVRANRHAGPRSNFPSSQTTSPGPIAAPKSGSGTGSGGHASTRRLGLGGTAHYVSYRVSQPPQGLLVGPAEVGSAAASSSTRRLGLGGTKTYVSYRESQPLQGDMLLLVATPRPLCADGAPATSSVIIIPTTSTSGRTLLSLNGGAPYAVPVRAGAAPQLN